MGKPKQSWNWLKRSLSVASRAYFLINVEFVKLIDSCFGEPQTVGIRDVFNREDVLTHCRLEYLGVFFQCCKKHQTSSSSTSKSSNSQWKQMCTSSTNNRYDLLFFHRCSRWSTLTLALPAANSQLKQHLDPGANQAWASKVSCPP